MTDGTESIRDHYNRRRLEVREKLVKAIGFDRNDLSFEGHGPGTTLSLTLNQAEAIARKCSGESKGWGEGVQRQWIPISQDAWDEIKSKLTTEAIPDDGLAPELHMDGITLVRVSKDMIVDPRVAMVNFPSTTHASFILSDGRWVSLPLDWFPPLKSARPEQQAQYRILPGGMAVYWEGLNVYVDVKLHILQSDHAFGSSYKPGS